MNTSISEFDAIIKKLGFKAAMFGALGGTGLGIAGGIGTLLLVSNPTGWVILAAGGVGVGLAV